MLFMDGAPVLESPMRKLAWFALLIPLAAYAAGPGAPMGPPPGPPPDDDGGPGPIHLQIVERADELGISDQTVDQIVAIVDGERDEIRALHEDLREAREALHATMDAQKPDRGAVFAASDRLGDAQEALREAKLDVALQIRPLLTDAQWDALKPPPGGPHGRGHGGHGRGR